MTCVEALKEVSRIKEIAEKDKNLVVYLSMAFGNPYKELYSSDMVEKFCNDLSLLDIKTISLSDTIGVSSPHLIEKLFRNLTNSHPNIEFGAHFHTSLSNCDAILLSAYKSGCRRFDSTIKGFGGCPMANNDLVEIYQLKN